MSDDLPGPDAPSEQPADDSTAWAPADPAPHAEPEVLISSVRRRRRLGGPWPALAVVAVLAVGSAVYVSTAAADRASGSPEALIPASALAVVSADLGQDGPGKKAAYDFARKFPANLTKSDADLFALVAKDMFEGSCTGYAKDFKPWLGRRAMAAAVTAPGGASFVVVLETTKVGKARATLRKLVGCSTSLKGWALRNGYAVLGPTQDVVDATLKSAATKSLEENTQYVADRAAMPKDALVTAWADVRTSAEAGVAAMSKQGKIPAIVRFGMAAVVSRLKGRVVLTAGVRDGGAEVEAKLLGVTMNRRLDDALGMLRSLPAKSSVAFAADGRTPGVNPQSQVDAQVRRALVPLQADPATRAALAQFAVTPQNLSAILSDRMAIGVGSLARLFNSTFEVGVRSTVHDPAAGLRAARQIATAVNGFLASQGAPVQIETRRSGSDLVIAASRSWADAMTSGPTLTSNSQLTSLMKGAPVHTYVAFYLDFPSVIGLVPTSQHGVPADANALDSVGAYVGDDGHTLTARVRLIAG